MSLQCSDCSLDLCHLRLIMMLKSQATKLMMWILQPCYIMKPSFNITCVVAPYNWRARCKNGLSDDFGPTLTKLPNYLLSCNVTVAKWIVSCSQHIVLVIWIEFPPKLYQVTLLLARKVKLPKCQQIPIISAGGKKQFCCCPWWIWLKKKNRKLDLQQWIT